MLAQNHLTTHFQNIFPSLNDAWLLNCCVGWTYEGIVMALVSFGWRGTELYIYYLLLLSIYILVFKQVAEDHWWWRHQLDNSTIERCGYSSRGNASELTRMLPTCRWWRNRLSKKVCLACIYIVTLIYMCMHTHTPFIQVQMVITCQMTGMLLQVSLEVSSLHQYLVTIKVFSPLLLICMWESAWLL